MSFRTLLRTVLAMFTLTALNPAYAKTVQTQSVTPVQIKQDADPALWVVKDKDTTIYLFGSVHVLKPGLSWFDEAVKQAFDKSDTLMLEVVLPDDPKAIQGEILKTALDLSGPALSDKLDPTAKKALHAELARLGMPDNSLDRFKPWFAAMMISQKAMKEAGYNAENGVEKSLTAAAKANGKPIKGLETIAQQFGYLNSLPEDVQIAMLNQTIAQMPEFQTMLGKMVSDWSQGKPDELAKLMNRDMGSSPLVAKALLFDRNARWAKWISERMKQPGTVFIAVGAGHLAGDHSVQRQLRRYHLKAKRIAY